MKLFGIALAVIGAAILGYFGLIGIDTGIEGFRATNLAALFIGSAFFVGGSIFAAAGEIIDRLLLLDEKPRMVIVKETISKSAPGTANTSTAQRPSTPKKPEKDGEQVLVENYKGVPIYQRYNGHFIGEKWFAGLKQAKQHIEEQVSD
jgi:hypothetical protein